MNEQTKTPQEQAHEWLEMLAQVECKRKTVQEELMEMMELASQDPEYMKTHIVTLLSKQNALLSLRLDFCQGVNRLQDLRSDSLQNQVTLLSKILGVLLEKSSMQGEGMQALGELEAFKQAGYKVN